MLLLPTGALLVTATATAQPSYMVMQPLGENLAPFKSTAKLYLQAREILFLAGRGERDTLAACNVGRVHQLEKPQTPFAAPTPCG